MILRGGTIVNNDFVFEHTDIQMLDGKIAAIGTDLKDGDVADCSHKIIVPGLFDIHTHDCFGYQLAECTPKSLEQMARFYGRSGVTSYLATLDSQPLEILAQVSKNIGTFIEGNHEGAVIRGIHLEGLYFNEKRKGGHPANLLRIPDAREVRHLDELSGHHFKLVCVAPELDGADEFIQNLSKDMVVSLAHTDADYRTAIHALKQGARSFTHLFNGMRPLTHREPGVVGAAMDSDEAYAEIITDGMHLAPAAVRLVCKTKGFEHVIFISDSCMATGLSDGIYKMGTKEKRNIVVEHGLAHLEGTDTICGSTFTLYDMFRNAVLNIGIDFIGALKACSINPARLMGMDDTIGSIGVGKDADVLILDEHMNLEEVYIKGQRYGCREHKEGGDHVF